jgi:hypothetical protein
MTTENTSQQNQEPVPQTEPSWIYETESDKEDGVETKKYDNGQTMKRAKLIRWPGRSRPQAERQGCKECAAPIWEASPKGTSWPSWHSVR